MSRQQAEQFSRFPDEPKRLKNWVCWQIMKSTDSPGTKKIPINPMTGKHAKSNDPKTWGTFGQAIQALDRYDCQYPGIMFQRGIIWGLDIDHCIDADRVLSDDAKFIIATMDSYTEVSPSGTGIHIIAYGQKPDGGCRKGNVEMYDAGRGFTVTGNSLGTPRPVRDCTDAAKQVHQKYIKPKPKASIKTNSGLARSEQTVIDAALRSKKGSKIEELLDGDWSRYKSQSEGDQALCNHLAFFTGRDANLIDTLFRKSSLYRQKWDEKRGSQTYGQLTIQRAIEGCQEVYTPKDELAQKRCEATIKAATAHPVINANEGDLGRLAGDILEALKVQNEQDPFLYKRGSGLARIEIAEDKQNGEIIHRPLLGVVNETFLRGQVARAADFMKESKQGSKAVDPPLIAIRDILEMGEWDGIPLIQGITQAPIFHDDGTIFDRPGYDPVSLLYYRPEGALKLPEIPAEPGQEDREKALNVLNEIFCDFPFTSGADYANTLGTALTVILRPIISGPCPAVYLNKHQAGSGATLLGNAFSVISSGIPAYIESLPVGNNREEELRKRVTSILLEGRPLVMFDNIELILESAVLGAVLTTERWQDRLLGQNVLISVPQRTVWMFNGNNLRVSGDLPRRGYEIVIDPKRPRPWQRDPGAFKHPELLKWIRENRGEILAAIFTLARSWIKAGKPKPKDLPVLGGFESWTRIIGGILQYAGVEKFLGNLDELYEKSELDDGWEKFLTAWYEKFLENKVKVKEIIEALQEDKDFADYLPPDLDINDKTLSRKMGRRFSKKEGIRFNNGLYIERAGKVDMVLGWRVRLTEGYYLELPVKDISFLDG